MVEHTIRSVDPSASFKAVTASRGKIARAEPISALYEQGRVFHVGAFLELEDQMCSFASDGVTGGHDDRADALVWAISELCLGESVAGWVQFYAKLASRAQAGKPIVGDMRDDKQENASIVDRITSQRPATVKLKAERPGQGFYIGTRMYLADNDAVITVVSQDVTACKASGARDFE